MQQDQQAVLDFWFGELDADGLADEAHSRRWWKKDPAFDAEVRERFRELHRAVAAGARGHWLATPDGRLAAIIVLDQLPRNMFRDSPQMFATDGPAQELTLEGLGRGDDEKLALAHRTFFYMPLMHAEDLALQDRCIALFSALRDALCGRARERIDNNVDFAVRHREIIARFGRFPHRNAILGRTSTPEEAAFLEQPGSSF